jgi:hypothetical protein
MAGTVHNDRLLRAVFSKDLERRHPMRTSQLEEIPAKGEIVVADD